MVAEFEIVGRLVMSVHAGLLYPLDGSLSFLVSCETLEEVDLMATGSGQQGERTTDAMLTLSKLDVAVLRAAWTERYGTASERRSC